MFVIVVNNLLERTYDPAKFLAKVHERLNDGGLLVIACTNEWREDITAKANWIGGYKDATGENVVTLDGLASHLSGFTQIEEPVDIPFALRRQGRAYESYVSQISFWEKQ